MVPANLLTGGSGTGIDGTGATVLVNPSSSTTDPDYVTFRKATYGTGTRGGPTPTYPHSVTMAATVALSGVPTRLSESAMGEPRPLARTMAKVTTTADPATYLGSALATDDLMDWRGQAWIVSGSSIYQAGSYITMVELTS